MSTSDYKIMVLADYLMGKVPAGSGRVSYKTSYQIQQELCEMVELEIDSIAQHMKSQGYIVGEEDGRPAWELYELI